MSKYIHKSHNVSVLMYHNKQKKKDTSAQLTFWKAKPKIPHSLLRGFLFYFYGMVQKQGLGSGSAIRSARENKRILLFPLERKSESPNFLLIFGIGKFRTAYAFDRKKFQAWLGLKRTAYFCRKSLRFLPSHFWDHLFFN